MARPSIKPSNSTASRAALAFEETHAPDERNADGTSVKLCRGREFANALAAIDSDPDDRTHPPDWERIENLREGAEEMERTGQCPMKRSLFGVDLSALKRLTGGDENRHHGEATTGNRQSQAVGGRTDW